MSRFCLILALAFGFTALGSPQTKTPQGDQRLEKRITSNIEGNLSSVLKWLSGQGVSFIVRETLNGSNNTIRVNVVNQPLSDVMDAIAYCMSGHWQRVGKIYVLKSGRAEDGDVTEAVAVPVNRTGKTEPEKTTSSHRTNPKTEAIISPTSPMILDEAKLRKSMDKEQWQTLVKKQPLPVALLARWQQKLLSNVPTNYMLRLKWDGTLYLAEK